MTVRRRLRRLVGPVPEQPQPSANDDRVGPDGYTREPPSAQLALDLFAGQWSSRLPDATGLVTGGDTRLFEDPRVAWVIERMGGLAGARVLELGPLEAGHSSMLQDAGAEVVAVESNSRAYLKCLVVKEVLGLTRCRFLYGDFHGYLAQRPASDRFTLTLASGVLYHATEPLDLLDGLATTADSLAIWTHYYDAEIVAAKPLLASHFRDIPREVVRDAMRIPHYRRDYLGAVEWKGFCGGPRPFAHWLRRDDLFDYLGHVGYTDIEVGSEDRDHVNGPAILLLARR